MFVQAVDNGFVNNDGAALMLNDRGGRQGFGAVGSQMSQLSWDSGYLRPFYDKYDRPRILVNSGRFTYEKGERLPIKQSVPVLDVLRRGIVHPVLLSANATSLRKEAWIHLDKQVLTAARQRMRAWSDLVGSNSFGGFDAMAKLTLEYEAMSDPGEAVVDMDGITEGRHDSPLFSLRSLPLPITHSDFFFTSRRLATSRSSGTPLDTTMGECAGRRVGELVEKTTIGLETGMTYGTQTTGVTAHTGTSTVYGYTNFPSRLTKTNFTAPTAGGWVPDTTRNEVITALNQLYAQFFYGPFVLYHSIDWSPYMERVYSVSGGNNNNETLRSMLLKTDGITDVRRLDFLTSTFTFILVQQTSDVARGINGMDLTTVQWESKGGLQVNYKVMVIWVPQLRYDYGSRTGILHGTTA